MVGVVPAPTAFLYFFTISLKYIYLSVLSISMSVRISLDLTLGTFSKLEEVCREEYQNKAQFLRQLLDKDFKERKR